MKLLIVDDNARMRALIRQLAAAAADDVRECANAGEALQVAREFSPDIVTMDVRLGNLDGIMTARALRTVCPTARVVMVSAYDQSALRQAAAAAGAIEFVSKDKLMELPALFARLAGNTAPSQAPDTPRG